MTGVSPLVTMLKVPNDQVIGTFGTLSSLPLPLSQRPQVGVLSNMLKILFKIIQISHFVVKLKIGCIWNAIILFLERIGQIEHPNIKFPFPEPHFFAAFRAWNHIR
jgi:hypothetical protein